MTFFAQATAISMATTICCQFGATPIRIRPLRTALVMRAPSVAPVNRPTPPCRLIPPMTAAAIALSSPQVARANFPHTHLSRLEN
jgi:hypothetical protein